MVKCNLDIFLWDFSTNRYCTWGVRSSAAFLLTSRGSRFISAADFIVVVFWRRREKALSYTKWTQKGSEVSGGDHGQTCMASSFSCCWRIFSDISFCLSSDDLLSFFKTPLGKFCFCSGASHLTEQKNEEETKPKQFEQLQCFWYLISKPVLGSVRVHETHPAVWVPFLHSVHLKRQRPPLQTLIYRWKDWKR